MGKFIKGSFELAQDVVDIAAFAKQHEAAFAKWIDFANQCDIEVSLGTSADNTFLCEYKVTGKTLAYCKGVVAELKHKIKEEFPKMRSSWQGSGDILY